MLLFLYSNLFSFILKHKLKCKEHRPVGGLLSRDQNKLFLYCEKTDLRGFIFLFFFRKRTIFFFFAKMRCVSNKDREGNLKNVFKKVDFFTQKLKWKCVSFSFLRFRRHQAVETQRPLQRFLFLF